MKETDLIDLHLLKECADETIEWLNTSYVGARAMDDVEAMQAFSNAIAALECIKVLPNDTLEHYMSRFVSNGGCDDISRGNTRMH